MAALVDEALARFTIGPEADEADEERELRRAERAVLELLATEGYFEPTLRFEPVMRRKRALPLDHRARPQDNRRCA